MVSSHFIFIFYLFDVFLILFKSSYFCYFSFFIAYNTVLDSLYCNLKKILALVLAFACAFTMFAGAAFTDSADIKATEAVNMLSALGVINGYTDGSFKPNDTVTRAEMAKMIYVLRTGSDKATAYENATTKFTDVKGHWAAPYIKYCEAMGIIAGKSATKFAPDVTVTGEETAKMLLVTIGYDATKAGLVGTAWAQKSTALATENGLLEDVDASLGLALPRQWAAQMIYNAVDADTVSYNADGQVVKTEKTENATVPYVSSTTKKYDAVNKDGKVIATFDSYTDAQAAIKAAKTGEALENATIKTRSEDVYTYVQETKTKNETVGEKYLDLHTTTGVLMVAGNTSLNASLSAGDDLLKVVFVDTDVDEGTKTSFTKVKTDYTDLLGQRVKVLYKETDKVIGVYADNDNTVVAGVASDLDTVSNEVKVKIDGTKYSFDDTFALYINNAQQNSKTYNAAAIKSYVDAVSDSDFEMKAIDLDGNGKIDTIRVITKTFGKMSSVSASTVYVKNIVAGNTVSTKKFDIEDDEPEMYDGIKKDDYVFVGVNQFTGNPTIVKATEVTGKATALKDNKVQIDGKWYKLKNANKSYTNLDIDKQYTLQVFGAYAYDVDGANASDIDTLLVKTVGDKKTLDKGVEAKVLFEDGTEKVINVVKVGDTGNSNLDTLKDKLSAGLYEYDEDDGDYTLKSIKTAGAYTNIDGEKTDFAAVALTQNTGKANGFDKDESTIEGKDIADDAVIFMMYQNSSNEDKYKVISGKTLMSYSDIKGSKVSGVALYDTSDKDKVKVAYIAKTGTISSGDSLYGMVTGVQYKKNADGDKVAYVSVLNNAGTEEVTVETDKSSVSFKKGDIVEITGSWTAATEIEKLNKGSDTTAQGYGAIKTYNESTKRVSFQTVDGNTLQSAKITGDTTVLFVDMSGDDPKAVASGSYDEALELLSDAGALYGYKANAFAKIDATDSEFDLLVVEVNNEFKNSGCKNVIELYTTSQGDVSGKTYTVAGQASTAVQSTSNSAKFTVTPSTTSAKWGEKVTMTVELDQAVPSGKKVTVKDGSNELAVIAAGKTTATYTVEVTADTTVSGVTATEA